MFEETRDREKGLSGIKNLKLIVRQDIYGYYITNELLREATYSKASLPRYARCCNTKCQQGGLDLQIIALYSANGQRNISCPGHEGSPKGRRKGDSCDNVFTVIVEIERGSKTKCSICDLFTACKRINSEF